MARPGGFLTTSLGAAALVAASALVPTALVDAQAADCAMPFAPIDVVDVYPGGEEVPVIPGEDAMRLVPTPAPLDSDDDGAADTIDISADDAVVTRGDGDLTFSRSGVDWVAETAGDLDGDGRDEILVHDPTGTKEQYVVPGTTAPGTYDPASVGIRVGDGMGVAVPDRSADGGGELLVTPVLGGREIDGAASGGGNGTTTLTIGAAIMAVAPGGDARTVEPVAKVDGGFLGFVDSDFSSYALMTAERQGDGGIRVHLFDDQVDIRFTTGAGPAATGATSLVGGIQYLRSDAGWFIVMGQGSRSGNVTYIWRVDDPCGPLPPQPGSATTTVPATAPATAQGAEPVSGASSFTG